MIVRSKIVAKSYTQAEGVDYEYTFSSLKAMLNVRSLLTTAPTNGWGIEQLGANNTFLDADSQEVIQFHTL